MTFLINNFSNKKVLLLQGPLGPFFRRFKKDLEDNGADVKKVAFNAGDALFYFGTDYISYRGSQKRWPLFLKKLLDENKIDVVFLLGDMRPYHLLSIPVIKEFGAKLYVFEEGYLRPDFITLEKNGVNGNSSMSRDPEFYLGAGLKPSPLEIKVQDVFRKSAWLATYYYVACNFLFFLYPFYRHYRDYNVFKHAFSWVKSGYLKLKNEKTEAPLAKLIKTRFKKNYYFVPLQVWNDFQWIHSPFSDMEDFLSSIMLSFSRHADKQHKLIIKHHPADRAYKNYSALISFLAEKYDISKRVIYVFDLHLPTLLQNAIGTVVMNSTVGLSSITHGTVVKPLGNAVYDIPGLSFSGKLDDFWKKEHKVDKKLYGNFRGWLEKNIQFNGNFYSKIEGVNNHTGVIWPTK